jgi:HSP20 family molecular chaperone IbpA
MSRRIDPTDWMWAQAVDLLEQAEHMHRKFFRLSSSVRSPAQWEPPMDMFEDDRELVIVVAVPGVTEERIQISSEGTHLVVRAERPVPFAGARQALRHLEIPYGIFERRIPLPRMRLEVTSRELTHGCLILRLKKDGTENP